MVHNSRTSKKKSDKQTTAPSECAKEGFADKEGNGLQGITMGTFVLKRNSKEAFWGKRGQLKQPDSLGYAYSRGKEKGTNRRGEHRQTGSGVSEPKKQ